MTWALLALATLGNTIKTKDIVLNRLINITYWPACFDLLVLLVATAKIYFEEQSLVAGTKQSNQADKAVRSRLTSKAG